MSQNKAGQKPIRDLLKEKDAFLTGGEKIIEYGLRHPRRLIGAAAFLILAAVAVLGYQRAQEAAESSAAEAYERALAEPGPAAVITALEKVRAEAAGRPAGRSAALSLIGLYAETGAPERALPLAEDILRTLKPAEISLKPILLENLGGLYETAGDYAQAARTYNDLLAWPALTESYKPGLLLALGRVHRAAGDRTEALKTYERLIRDFPGSFQAYPARTVLAELRADPIASGPDAASPPDSGADAAGER